jgi:hypothetical protein
MRTKEKIIRRIKEIENRNRTIEINIQNQNYIINEIKEILNNEK